MDKQNQGGTPQKTVVIVQNRKSMVLALLLSFFFGPLGMLYATIGGGLIMLLLDIVIGIFTLGFGLFFLWPIQMIWTAIAVSNYNARQNAKARRYHKT